MILARIQQFLQVEEAATAAEYAVLLALILLALISADHDRRQLDFGSLAKRRQPDHHRQRRVVDRRGAAVSSEPVPRWYDGDGRSGVSSRTELSASGARILLWYGSPRRH